MICVSEYILCKGEKVINTRLGITVCELDEFLQDISNQIWKDSLVWTIKIKGHSIDYYLTKAQIEINRGITFEKTEFYAILCELIKNDIKLAMWYDIYYEELPVYNNLKDIIIACYTGIIDKSGMCEVYFRME